MEFNDEYWKNYLARPEVSMDAKKIRDTKSNLKNGKAKQRLQDVMLIGKISDEMETTVNDLTERLEHSEDQVHELENRVYFLEKCRDESQESHRNLCESYSKELSEEREKTRSIVKFLKDQKDDKQFAQVLWKLQSFWHDETGETLL